MSSFSYGLCISGISSSAPRGQSIGKERQTDRQTGRQTDRHGCKIKTKNSSMSFCFTLAHKNAPPPYEFQFLDLRTHPLPTFRIRCPNQSSPAQNTSFQIPARNNTLETLFRHLCLYIPRLPSVALCHVLWFCPSLRHWSKPWSKAW
jgi:hypothetical protein